jgi:seryl-tRNA synthetase
MLDIALFRENPELIKKNVERRNPEIKKQVDEVISLDKEWRALKTSSDQLRAERNTLSEQINKAKKEGKDISVIIKKVKSIPEEIAKNEERIKQLEANILTLRMKIPNLLHDSVPKGKDGNDNPEIKKVGKPKKFNFELKSHGEIAENLGIANFKRATQVAGAGFVYLKGDLALLDLALQRFAIDHLIKKGFTLIEPPFMLNRKSFEGVIDLTDFENVMYKIEGEDLYLIPTSEHPMVVMHTDEILELTKPLMYCGVSACFRKEIGSHGVDTRGLNRMHMFNKVEQVVFCREKDSWKLFEQLQKNTEELFKLLGIPFRVIEICTGDLSIKNAKQYDIEAWSPRENKYFEVTSCSNCTSYQAVRSNIKYIEGNDKKYVHTLNNTGIATSRAMRAILENYQNKDGSVTIPKVLIPYMLGKKKII